MTNDRKTFHIGDLLSVTTNILVSPRYMDGVYDLIQFLTREQPAFDALTAQMLRCRPYVLHEHPDLAAVDPSGIDFESWRDWLALQAETFGEWMELRRPEPGEIGAV